MFKLFTTSKNQQPVFRSQILPADKVVGDSMFPKDRLSFEHSVFPPDHFVTPTTASADLVATVYQLPVNSVEGVLDQAA